MSDPGTEAVEATLAQQAAAAAPADAVPALDLSAATPAVADIDALRTQLAEAEAKQAAAAAAVATAVEAAGPQALIVDANAPSWFRLLVDQLEQRLRAAGI